MKNFDINYKFHIGDRFIALRNIKYSDIFIKKGSIITIKGIDLNTTMFLERPIRRVDLRFDCYIGIFIYTNSLKIIDNIPSWYHPFNLLSDFASLKDNRKDKLKKLYDTEGE
jgi:hypothetical protein